MTGRMRIVGAIILCSPILPLGAGAEETQIFTRRGLGDTYSGVEAWMSAQDPYLTCCNQFDSTGPVALMMVYVSRQPFIEGGNGKVWRSATSSYELHPYWSYSATGSTVGGGWFYSIYLTPAQYYEYSVYPTGSCQQFKVRFCDAG